MMHSQKKIPHSEDTKSFDVCGKINEENIFKKISCVTCQVSGVTCHISHTHTAEGHCNLKTISAQWADSVTSKLAFPGGIRPSPMQLVCSTKSSQPLLILPLLLNPNCHFKPVQILDTPISLFSVILSGLI